MSTRAAVLNVSRTVRALFDGVTPIMTRLFSALMALVFMMASAASATTLTSRPSTVLFSGEASYAIDLSIGSGEAFGLTTDGAYDLFLSGFFDANTQGDNPVDVDLTLTDLSTFDVAVNARELEEVEIGAGLVALLFGDLTGGSAGGFTGGKLLAILIDPAFPALAGDAAKFELRRLDDLGVIPLPATAPLLIGGLAALGLMRRRSRAARARTGAVLL